MTKSGATTIIKTAFVGVDEETLNILRRMAALKEYPARTVLCRQGEIEHTFYVVVNGRGAAGQECYLWRDESH